VAFSRIATLAQVDAGRPTATWGMLWTLFALGTVVVIGALVILWADRFRKTPVEEGLTLAEQMSEFQQLFDRGELSKEEFQRIKDRLERKTGKEPPPSVPPQANGSPTA
jgi:uncharacterized membrane protein